MSRLLNERGAAKYLGIPQPTLHRLRCEGVVPAAGYAQVRLALYDPDDLDKYAEAIGRQRTYNFGDESIVVIYDEENQ